MVYSTKSFVSFPSFWNLIYIITLPRNFFAQKRSILINLPALLELNLEFYILYTILNNSFLSNFSCEFEFSNAIFWFNVARYVYIQIAKGSLSNRVFIHPPCKYWRIGVAFWDWILASQVQTKQNSKCSILYISKLLYISTSVWVLRTPNAGKL